MNAGSPFERILVALDLNHDPETLLRVVQALPGLKAMRIVNVVRDISHVDEARLRLNEVVVAAQANVNVESDVLVGAPASRKSWAPLPIGTPR